MGAASALTRWRPGRGLTPHLLAILLVGAATAAGVGLDRWVPHTHPFSLYFPAVLGAALFGGWLPGLTALATGAVAGWGFFIAPADLSVDLAGAAAILVYLFAGAFMVLAGARLRTLLADSRASNARLAERELRYRTLFDAVSEGFALVEAIRDGDGRLVDYLVLEANPAILRMLGADASVIGKRQSEILHHPPDNWLRACAQALKGRPINFEYYAPRPRRWYDIHLSRIGDDQLVQFVVDITDRKLAEVHQSELFDELNHRVKNNLAMVSSMLAMQARAADDPQLREHLTRAVDRIQTIADVHASLYRSSRKDDVDFAAYLQDLCARLSGALLEGDRVRLQVDAEPATLPLDKAVALGVVVNELVTNAAKHAYPPPASGVVTVALRRTPGGLSLVVRDSGRGLPPAPPGNGLGMRLVRSLVHQIGGVLEVGSGPGAAFAITLPDPSA